MFGKPLMMPSSLPCQHNSWQQQSGRTRSMHMLSVISAILKKTTNLSMACCMQRLQSAANMKSTIGIGWSTAPKQVCPDTFLTDEPGFACFHPSLFTGYHWHTEKGLQDPNPGKHAIWLLHCARCPLLQPRYGGGIWQQTNAK